MSSSLYATLPDTPESSFAREMTDMQSEVHLPLSTVNRSFMSFQIKRWDEVSNQRSIKWFNCVALRVQSAVAADL